MTIPVNKSRKAPRLGILLALAALGALLLCAPAAWAGTVTITQIGPQTVSEGGTLTFTVIATTTETASNKRGISFTLGNAPTLASLTPTGQGNDSTRSATFSCTPSYDQAGNYPNVIITATDKPGGSASTTFSITVGNVNRPPVLDPITSPISINEGQTLSFGITGSDPDGDAITYSASNLPSGATLTGNSFSWTPTYLQKGTYNVLFTVTDNGSPTRTASQTVQITVGNVNRPPTLNPIGSQTADAGTPLSFTVSATDPDTDDTLTFSASGLPPGAGFDPATQTFTWTPGYDQAGNYTVTFAVSDGYVSVTQNVSITVNANRPPVLDPIGDKTVNEGETLTFAVTGGDPDTGDAVTFSTGTLPTGATFDPISHTFSWTPAWGQVGNYSVQFTVTDGGTPPLSDSKTISIAVGHTNRAPILSSIGAKSVDEGQPLTFTVSATDPDGDALTYSAAPLPLGAGFDTASGVFTWTPEFNQAGSYNVLFTVTDGKLSASETITITAGNVNRPPVLAKIGDQSVNEGQTLSFTVSATDPDADPLTYTISNPPKGATFDPATRTFTWTPDYDQAGNYPKVLFSVTDGDKSASEEVTITVGNTNRPPVLDSPGDKQIDENKLLTFVVTATDQDQDALTFSASNLPGNATFDLATRTFSWTPTYEDAGSYSNVTFNASDGKGGSDSKSITITVANVNRPPKLDPIGAKSVSEGQLLQFTVTGSDPDNNTITFSADSIAWPQGAIFDPNTRTFTWTPDYSQAGSYPVNFYVQDNGGTPLGVAQETVTITVGNVNRAPVFSTIGTVSTKEGQVVSFTVSATDPDGDQVTCSCSNLPAEAIFNGNAFTWTPSYGQAGSYTVTFCATDNGTPAPQSAETSVVISVNQPSPSALINSIVNYVLSLHLDKNVENSYIANLKKVDGFIANGQKTPAINQLNATIQKINQDLKKGGLIAPVPANKIILMTNELLSMLTK